VVRGSDVYISTRSFQGRAKVSVHASGQCQWSLSDKWVTEAPDRRNADRHIQKWSMPRQIAQTATNIFHARVPETELRVIQAEEDLSTVQWLPPPTLGSTTSLECYITPISDADPSLLNVTPHPCILALPLSDGRWFIILHYAAALDGKQLGGKRQEMLRELRAAGIEPRPDHRGVAFVRAAGPTRGMIELCPIAV
jgi:hypothetical protein